MTAFIKTGLALLATSLATLAETAVFLDNAFPYRIVCQPEWVETAKNDTVLILTNTAAGKKTRLQLKKYPIDTSFDTQTMEWSRLNFAINKGFADAIGKMVFFDTVATKKLGGFRAYETFAFFSDSTTPSKIWWAEYARWTEHDGWGFLASIIGDTVDMKRNYASTYKAMLDSIGLTGLTSRVRYPQAGPQSGLTPDRSRSVSGWYDLLGRELPAELMLKDRLLVGKSVRQCRIRIR
jgi:hypothetical protein